MSQIEGQVKKHLHIYKRVRHPKRRDLFMCADPKCAHRTNKVYLVGKAAMCPYCNHEFVITPTKLNKQGLLHCDNCKRGGTGKLMNEQNPTVSEIEKLLKTEIL